MNKTKLLVVEDQPDIATMLRIYFSSQGYEVETASRGTEALQKTRQVLPHLILLDIMMPEMDGYEVCRQLRTTQRTKHIPIIFLTQKDDRSDKITGLQLGADDFITKPFDIEELKLRVQNTLRLSQDNNMRDSRTALPSGSLIEDELRQMIRGNDWAYMDCRIEQFEQFRNVYGFVAADDVLRFTRNLLLDALEHAGAVNDFIGHPSSSNFVLITHANMAHNIKRELKRRFNRDVRSHYNFQHAQLGYLPVPDGKGGIQPAPLMSLSIGVVTPATHWFSDIREITEQAVEARRMDAQQTSVE